MKDDAQHGAGAEGRELVRGFVACEGNARNIQGGVRGAHSSIFQNKDFIPFLFSNLASQLLQHLTHASGPASAGGYWLLAECTWFSAESTREKSFLFH